MIKVSVDDSSRSAYFTIEVQRGISRTIQYVPESALDSGKALVIQVDYDQDDNPVGVEILW